MKKKKNQSNSPENNNLSDSQVRLQNSTSSFSIFLTSSSSSIRQILPQRKGVYQTPISNTNQGQNQFLNHSNQNKKIPKKNINDIIYDDSLLRTPETKSFLNDPFCIQNRKFLFQKLDFSLFQDDDLNRLLCHLREYSIDSAINRKYSEAKKSDALFDQIQFELMQRSIPSNKKKNEIEHSFEEQKKEEMAKLDNEILEFDAETKEKRIQLLNKQIDDSNEFEKKWREEKPPKYRKPSSKLLHLLASEKRLARVGEYDEAQLYKAESEKLIIFEMNQAQSLLNRDYKIAKAKFIKKQEEEFQHFTESRQQQRDLILAKRMATEETIQKREYIILDKIAQIPKTKNSEESSPLVENQNFIGNAWLKYGTGGNIAKAMYDDHITFENPIPPLLPPNDDYEVKPNEIRKKTDNDNKPVQNQIKKVSQKNPPRLNSVGQNIKRETSSKNSHTSNNENQKISGRSNSKESNRLSSSLKKNDSFDGSSARKKTINNHSIQNRSDFSSSSISSKNKIMHSNRLSSASKSSPRKQSVSSKYSKQDFEHSNSSKRNLNDKNQKNLNLSKINSDNNYSTENNGGKNSGSKTSSYLSTKSNGIVDKKNLDSKLSSDKFSEKKLNSSNSLENKETDLNSKKNSSNINDSKIVSDSSVLSAASDEFAGSNSG